MILQTDRKHDRTRRHERGSILVICMVLAAFGTIGVAAWLSLLDARGHQVEQNLTALKRRAHYNNGRALAHLAIYKNHLHVAEGVAADVVYEIPGGLGRATVRAYDGAPLRNQSSVRRSKIGAVPLRSFSTDVRVDLPDGAGDREWQFQLRSYNPVLAGDLLVMHPLADPEDTSPMISGNLAVKGRAVFWDAVVRDFTAGLRADEYHLPVDIAGQTSFATSAGGSTLPLNYPRPRQTTGFAGSTDPYRGGLDIVRSIDNSHNAYATRVQASGTFLELNGSTPYARGDGPDTEPPGPGNSDDSKIKQIDEVAASGTGHDSLYNRLLNAPRLSSDVMVHAVETPAAFHPGKLYEILDARHPLPIDVLTAVAGETTGGITEEERDALFRKSNVWIWSNGAGKIVVYLWSPNLQHLIMREVTELVLEGPDDPAVADSLSTESPVALLVDNPPGIGLDRVEFNEQNKRRIVLALSTASPASGDPDPNYSPDMVFTGSLPFPDWRMILDLQNTGAVFDTTAIAGATVVGGIRANRPLRVAAGRLTLEREFDTNELETLLSRNAWIESYLQ